MLQHYYQECSHRLLQADYPLPTYVSGGYRSTIDYMYVAPSLADFLHASDVEFICPQWTDHAMLSLQFKMRNTNHGRGLWRTNPRLAFNRFFVSQLYSHLDDFHLHLASSSFLNLLN